MGRVFIYMERYGVITEKRKREIVLLRGKGCAYAKCPFCDYHLDKSPDESENFKLNSSVLERVTGVYGELEVINSGSAFELGAPTLELIKRVCLERKISVIHFESHYMYDRLIPSFRKSFDGFELKMKLGLETFDYAFREDVLKKGIPVRDPSVISRNFDEANFLFGLKGQTLDGMERDVELGLKYFERICINVMCDNSTAFRPDDETVALFMERLYPRCRDDARIDVLTANTDFGVGADD